MGDLPRLERLGGGWYAIEVGAPPRGYRTVETRMTTILANAFSLSMLPDAPPGAAIPLLVQTLDETAARTLAQAARDDGDLDSCVGHPETAAIMSQILGVPVPVRRESVQIGPDLAVLVAQYSRPRLPEGATTLPPGARLVWRLVYLDARTAG